MKFPTGGIVRESLRIDPVKFRTDSKVWMEEGTFIVLISYAPESIQGLYMQSDSSLFISL